MDVPTLRSIDAGDILARTITLVRHGETTSNIAGRWQGQTDSPLTPRGVGQVDLLRERRRDVAFDLLITSDLGRAVTTGAAIGEGESSAEWREMDLGSWDGLRPAEIAERVGAVDRSRFGEVDFQPDGGERFSDFLARIRRAFDATSDRLDDGEHGVVVTHGGVIETVVSLVVGVSERASIVVPSNASITTINLENGRPQLVSFNDDLHLNGGRIRPPGPRLHLVRHAETEANREGRWWGRGETPLTARGRRQAEALADVVGPYGSIVSSPSSRARDTAAAVAARSGDEVAVRHEFAEMHFGAWEGLTPDEARAADPGAFRRIFDEGRDEPRGGSGESFEAAGRRFAGAAVELADSEAETIGVFTHGGVTRAYIAGLLGVPFAERAALPIQRNTAHAEVIFTSTGPRLSAYNIAAHLGD